MKLRKDLDPVSLFQLPPSKKRKTITFVSCVKRPVSPKGFIGKKPPFSSPHPPMEKQVLISPSLLHPPRCANPFPSFTASKILSSPYDIEIYQTI